MNEIKFACPHCNQHIACDEGYCNYQIRCPACEGGLIVPRLATFGFGSETSLSLAVPVATPVPRVAADRLSKDPISWSEAEWNKHEAELERACGFDARAHPAMLIMVIAPALAGMLVFSGGLSKTGYVLAVPVQAAWMVLNLVCSLVCAMILSRTISDNIIIRGVLVLVLGFALAALNLTLALFLGCAAGLMKSASGG